MNKLTIATCIVLSIHLPAFAQGGNPGTTPGVDQRQGNQQQRIDAGVQSGRLNANEATRMQQGQARIQAIEDKSKADGVVSKQERVRLQHAQNQQSRRIVRQKHDRQ